jgi:hypothetical protein
MSLMDGSWLSQRLPLLREPSNAAMRSFCLACQADRRVIRVFAPRRR